MIIRIFYLLLLLPIISSSSSTSCSQNQFKCNSYSWKQNSCIPLTSLCDNVCNCLMCEDEHLCNAPIRSCNYNLNASMYGLITSPRFPSSYVRGQQCRWLIQLGYYSQVELRSLSFLLPQGDSLIIYDGAKTSSKILGEFGSTSRIIPKLTSSTGSVLVVLRSKRTSRSFSPYSFFQSNGFNLTYQMRGECYPGLQRSCGERDLTCYDVLRDRCTGTWECPVSGADELGCGVCSRNQFYCPEERSCYTRRQRCDGKAQCRNLHDELKCDHVHCGPHNGTFLCNTGQCIFESWRCDGAIDCTDGSDEVNCPIKVTSKRVILAAVVGSLMCGLVIVLSMSYVCRVHAMRALIRTRASMCQYESPLQGMIEADLRRRPPPPHYEEAMRTSRPFDDVFRDLFSANRNNHYLQRSQEGNDEDDQQASGQQSIPTLSSAEDDDVGLIDMDDSNPDQSPAYESQSNETACNGDVDPYDVPMLDDGCLATCEAVPVVLVEPRVGTHVTASPSRPHFNAIFDV